jgi:hypothetical protein
VTAAAHLPRSLVEIRAKLPPDVVLVPHPVAEERTRPSGWIARPQGALSLAYEFSKYVVSLARQRLAAAPPRTEGGAP